MDINENEFTKELVDANENQNEGIGDVPFCCDGEEQNCNCDASDNNNEENATEESDETSRLLKKMLLDAIEEEIKVNGNLNKVSEKTLKTIESKISEKNLMANVKRIDAIVSFINNTIHKSISGSDRDIYGVLSNVEQVITSILVRFLISIFNYKNQQETTNN